MPGQRTVFRICTLCEATCGIEVVVEQGVIIVGEGLGDLGRPPGT